MKYRKKPVVIDAIRFTGEPLNIANVADFLHYNFCSINREEVLIPTLEGLMHANRGDWIIKGVKGEFYPVKDDIFRETYEQVNDAT